MIFHITSVTSPVTRLQTAMTMSGLLPDYTPSTNNRHWLFFFDNFYADDAFPIERDALYYALTLIPPRPCTTLVFDLLPRHSRITKTKLASILNVQLNFTSNFTSTPSSSS